MTEFTDAELREAMKTAADKFESGEWGWRQDGLYGPYKLGGNGGDYCLIGGVCKALKSHTMQLHRMHKWLEECRIKLFPRRKNRDPTYCFNDRKSTTKADVIAVLRCGAES